MRASAIGLVVVLLATSMAGCLDIHAARVPDKYLEGRGGNGWAKNLTASQPEPDSRSLGFVKTWTLAYEDRVSDEGYTGSLTLTTLRTLLRPSEASLRDQVEAKVREAAQRNGIRIEGNAIEGTRRLASGAESFWFTHNGTVDRANGLFALNARVKLLGEVWQCSDEKTVVVAVALAQVTETRTVAGVLVDDNPDDTTWREIARDPRGSIQGARGADGLVYNVAC